MTVLSQAFHKYIMYSMSSSNVEWQRFVKSSSVVQTGTDGSSLYTGNVLLSQTAAAVNNWENVRWNLHLE